MVSTTVYLIFMEVLLARNFRNDVGQCGSWFSTGSPTLSSEPVRLSLYGCLHSTQEESPLSSEQKARSLNQGFQLPTPPTVYWRVWLPAPCLEKWGAVCEPRTPLLLVSANLWQWTSRFCNIEMLGTTGFVVVIFGVKVSLCRPGWPQTQCHPPASSPNDGILGVGNQVVFSVLFFSQ